MTYATVLGTFSFSEEYRFPVGGGGASTGVTIHFGYSVAPGGLEDETTIIFDALSLVDTDDGRVFELRAIDDPELPAFFARAANAVDDDIRVNAIGNVGGGVGKVGPESVFLTTFTGAGPDFAGSTMTALQLVIDDIEINANAAVGELNWRVNGELRFIGTALTRVPLPPGILLLASSWSLLVFRFRQRFVSTDGRGTTLG